MKPCLLFVLALAVLTGCGQHSASIERASLESQKAQAPGLAQDVSSDGGAAAPTVPVPHTHMIVRSADMTIVAMDPAATLRNISTQVEARGGYVADSKQWRESGQAHATLTLRVPAPQLPATMSEIRKAALRIDTENVSGQDVSQEYTDLSAQLTNLEATERELRELLTTVRQRTQRASDVLDVFNQLTKIRGEIDQTKGRLLNMSQLVDLATISLEIVPDTVSQPLSEDAWRPIAVVRDAFRTLVATLKWLCDVLIWVGIYIIPLAALIGIPAFYIRRAYRTARARDEIKPSD